MNTRTLMLMRHGKSDWTTDTPWDFDRPLKARGENACQLMAQWLAVHGPKPDRVVTSTATRALETTSALRKDLQLISAQIHEDQRIYDACVETLLQVIKTHGAESKTLLLVGHNPGFENLLMFLSNAPLPPSNNGKLMPTAALATLTHYGAWDELTFGCCSDATVVRPRDLLART